MQFDMLIKGGEVVDPGSGRVGKFDVAIKRDRIAAVDANIPAESAVQVIDASGQFVTPGLVDLHTHVYHGVTYWGIDPDPVAARTGVTTWLDVGSAGAYNLIGLRNYVAKPAQARIYALLHISSIGLTAESWEVSNLNYCNVDLCCKLVNRNRDWVLGVKVRIDVNTVGQNGVEPLRRAHAAAERVGLPLMVHIADSGPTINGIAEVLPLMRPGDILTHCFTGRSMRIVDDTGNLLAVAKRAWESGVIMDIGHGAGSFSFETAEALIRDGYKPDVISSDIHQLSIHGSCFDLPTCLSKFLALGMSFREVIEKATVRPAAVLGLSAVAGTLAPGMLADVALFRIERGEYTFYDVAMNARTGHELIRNTLTIIGGRAMQRKPDGPTAPWIELSADQRALIDRGHTPEAFSAISSRSV
jgi:dihydroorotase